jgi:hypothetical protein
LEGEAHLLDWKRSLAMSDGSGRGLALGLNADDGIYVTRPTAVVEPSRYSKPVVWSFWL